MTQGFRTWSKTAASNSNADSSINWAEGQAPSSVNDSARAVMARLAEYRDDTNGLLTTGGTSTAYTVATNMGVATPTPDDGQLLVVSFHTLNGASPTLAADGGTAFPIQIAPALAVASGTLFANCPVALRFRLASSAWIIHQAGSATFALGVNTGAVTNAGLQAVAAWTLKGNNTGSSAAPQDFTIDALTAKTTPTGSDEVPIWDAAASQMKKATIANVSKGVSFSDWTVQRFTSGSGTYTPTAGTVRIRVRMCGGGGGGGAAQTNAGGNGTDTTFGGWTAKAGAGGAPQTANTAAGGTAGGNGTGTLVIRISGGAGSGSFNIRNDSNTLGGIGGANPFAGPGMPSKNGAGTSAAANTGAGGAGGATLGADNAGGGGGAGEYVEFFMTAAQIGASQSYGVGAKGTGGAAGGNAGGDGAAGVIIVEEFYI